MKLALLATVLVLLAGLLAGWLVIGRKRGTPRATPEAAVARLVEAITAGGDFTQDDLYAAMARAGVPDGDADRAFKFTQIAWGRLLLAKVGPLPFPSDYVCFDAAGDVIESGPLNEQPYYIAALAAARAHAGSKGFQRFALMSADVSAVNNALEAGSKLETLEMSPPALFLEQPTQAGLEKGQRWVTDWLTSHGSGRGHEGRVRTMSHIPAPATEGDAPHDPQPARPSGID